MQRSAFAWGLALVIFGGLLLLSRTGVLTTFSVWAVLWPLVLIALGLSFLFRGRGTDAHASPDGAAVGEGMPAQRAAVEQVVMQLKGAESAEIVLHPGPAGLTLDGTAPPDELLRGIFPGGLDYRAYDLGDGHVGLEFRPADPAQERGWRLALNPDVPFRIRLRATGGDSVLDLAAAQVPELDVLTGDGRLTVMLPANAGRTEVRAATDAGIIDLRIPPDVAAYVQSAGEGDGGLEVEGDRLLPSGDSYQSGDLETAANWAEITAAPGSGRIIVG